MSKEHASNKSSLPERLNDIRQILLHEYQKRHNHPWVIAYSGGKDSTLLLQLVWEVVLSLRPDERNRRVYITSNDTLVESPLVIDHLKESLSIIADSARSNDLPFVVRMTQPNIDQTFWVNVIGRGYIPPTRNFRWCTDRMKILPTNNLLENLLRAHRHAVLLIGTRRAESQNRRRNMAQRRVRADRMNRHDSLPGCRVFAPIADLSDDDVWTILLQCSSPWGGSHRDLITLYRNAGGGECPLVLSKDDAPSCGTTSPRFGCWTCTVVQKDRSMRGLIAAGHRDEMFLEALADFREWLIELREGDDNRMPVRRDGKTKIRPNGERVMGPFKFEVRKRILERLLELQERTGKRLITPSEQELIEDIWWNDNIRERGRQELNAMHGSVGISP